MNTLPTKWYIPLTPENYDEVKSWWVKQVEKSGWQGRHLDKTFIVLSVHPNDGSYYWVGEESYLNELFPSYQKITLEQFRQITKPMNTLPTKWYIGVTHENRDELDRWRKKVATSHCYHELVANEHTILSRHLFDGSCYYANPVKDVREHEDYQDYEEITIEQFRQITGQTQAPMSKSIQISRELLNEYYEASTPDQKEYLTENFKLDGTTTEEAIRGLHDMACSEWQPRIRKNHPECFPEDSKYLDFSAYVRERGNFGVVKDDVAELLGLSNDFIQIRVGGSENKNRSFYLSSDYDWELVEDRVSKVLIPTKKQS